MSKSNRYILGIDLGVSSLGWAMVEAKLTAEKWRPVSLIDAGVRIFEAGVEGDVEQGRDSSRGAKRRDARQPRRQQWRRQQRKRRLFSLLQKLDLLPASDDNRSMNRNAVLGGIDQQLAEKWLTPGDTLGHQKLPYLLRAAGVEKSLEPHELGRALYHLAQRRGFLSNRKSRSHEDSDGSVATGIKLIDEAAGEKTLGQFFAQDVNVFANCKREDGQRDPMTGRIRRRYTARQMYKEEFAAIHDRQRQAFPHLTDADWKEIERAIFFQRPLKSQRHLIGHCSIDKRYRRCLEALPIFQEFRILQAVNHLVVRLVDGTERSIEPEERQRVVDALQTASSMKLTQARKTANLPKGAKFTIEEWEDALPGHRTNQKLTLIFGDRWLKMPMEDREQIVREVVHFRKDYALKRRAMRDWQLNEEQAEQLVNTHLEEGYASHCRRVLSKLVAAMHDGTTYAEARKREYPESFQTGKVFDQLPPVRDWDKEIRNPAVLRALTEVRKVVNSLVRKHGVPTVIRIELARDLKNSRDKRRRIWQQNQENRKRRENAVAALLASGQAHKVSRNDIDKWLLADECNWECTYCGRGIDAGSLIGSHPQFDIEHILPRRFLDNSQLNKTLACRTCNHDKGNRLPAQAFSGARLDEIIARVQRFPDFSRFKKLERFKMTAVPEDFVTRDLNDTRYNSRQSANYLATLYGGRVDSEQRMRVATITGGLTALLRKAWGLNAILSGTDEKTRDDHRHHAIDAIITAVSDASLVQELSRVAQQHENRSDREGAFLSGIQEPWTGGFQSQIRDVIQRMHVSHRATRTLAGPLHAESIYSKPHTENGQTQFRIRKELTKLSAKEIEGDQIADPAIRKLVQDKFKELGGGLPSKVFADVDKHPCLPNKNGAPIPIHRVRMRVDAKPRSIGHGPRQRYVASGKDSNFASMVYAVLDKDGKETRWVHEIIDRLTAHERFSANRRNEGEKVLIPDEQGGKRRFKFALMKNDMLLMEGPNGTDELYRVQSLSANEIQLCEHNRANIEKTQRTEWTRIRTVDNLRKRRAHPVQISPIGDIVLEGMSACENLTN
ncbi:MAG: type II CRISPR RNA-guided endonuclease Cas9 [Planctomycetaceae bacterium]|nr:type II CRISPR RNA-guided endonuclease Cas9 [Planctomycetaceae bacterium]